VASYFCPACNSTSVLMEVTALVYLSQRLLSKYLKDFLTHTSSNLKKDARNPIQSHPDQCLGKNDDINALQVAILFQEQEGQSHKHTQYFWQVNNQIHSDVVCIYTILANPNIYHPNSCSLMKATANYIPQNRIPAWQVTQTRRPLLTAPPKRTQSLGSKKSYVGQTCLIAFSACLPPACTNKSNVELISSDRLYLWTKEHENDCGGQP
jgi:hypothetical protein